MRIVVALALAVAAVLPAQAACSSWRDKVWFNEYFFGSGGSAPPNYLELYASTKSYATQWQGSYVEVYSAANTKTTYTFTSAAAAACNSGNKTWITYNVPGGLRQQNALVILRDPLGGAIDAFVFDNTAPPAPWRSASNNWAPGYTTGCADLDAQLTQQAGGAASLARQANMLVLSSYGNKDFSRFPDGGSEWDDTIYRGAGTTYTQCVSNNANFTKVVDNTTPTPGSTVTFTLALANNDSSALSGVVIDDYLPDYSPAAGAPVYISAIPVNAADVVGTSTYATTDPNTATAVNATKITWRPAPVAVNATAKLNIKLQVPATATTGYIYKNTAQTTAGLDPNQTDFAGITIGSANVGSFVITIAPATASTCTPALLGPKVTVTAMTGPNGSGSVDTGYAGSAMHLFASSANPKWYNSAGTQITVAPVPAGSFVNGVATFYLTDATAETVTVSALDTVTYEPSVMQGTSGSVTFTSGSAGLSLTDHETGAAWALANPSYGVVAGRPHKVRATLSACGVAATSRTGSYSGTVTYTPGLNHPTGAGAPTVSTAAACPGTIGPLSTSAASSVTLAFTAGVADFYLCAADVGQFALNMTLNLTSPTTSVSGASGNFTVRPFALTAVPVGTGNIAAGDDFSVKFDAWNWWAAADEDANGIPDAAKTAAQLVSANPGQPLRFSGTTNGAGVIAFGPKFVAPATGTLTAFSPSTLAASNATVTASLSYPDVGHIEIAGPSGYESYGATNYLGTAGLHVPILGEARRFVPAYLETAVTPACGGVFTYSGQPFSRITVTAMNRGNTVTQNYTKDGAARDVTLTAAGAAGTITKNGTVGYDKFNAGTATLDTPATPTFTFAVVPSAPTSSMTLRATDADGVESAGHEGSTGSIRSGRLRLSNAFGSERADLLMPVQAQYWSGNAWVLNNADTCTALPANAFALSSGLTSASAAVALAGGSGTLRLTAPGAGNVGSVDIAANLGESGSDASCLSTHGGTAAKLPWLRSRNGSKYPDGTACPQTYDRDPSARATFGIYSPESRRTVDVRESF